MANSVTDFYQTLVAAGLEASQQLVGPTNLMNSVTRIYDPTPTAVGRVISVPIPASATATDIGSGDFVPQNIDADTVSFTFDKHPTSSYLIRDFEQFNSVGVLRTIFLDGMLKSLAEEVNRQIGALFTTGNFDAYAAVNATGAGGTHTITIGDYQKLWRSLASAKAPMKDFANLFFMVHPQVYGNLLGETTWTADSNVGYLIADEVRRKAMLGMQFGANTDWDPNMPVGAGTFSSTGDDVYWGALYHRNAIGMAIRPLPPPGPQVQYNVIFWNGLPIRVMLSYEHRSAGWLVSVDTAMALGVLRKELCALIYSD